MKGDDLTAIWPDLYDQSLIGRNALKTWAPPSRKLLLKERWDGERERVWVSSVVQWSDGRERRGGYPERAEELRCGVGQSRLLWDLGAQRRRGRERRTEVWGCVCGVCVAACGWEGSVGVGEWQAVRRVESWWEETWAGGACRAGEEVCVSREGWGSMSDRCEYNMWSWF